MTFAKNLVNNYFFNISNQTKHTLFKLFLLIMSKFNYDVIF